MHTGTLILGIVLVVSSLASPVKLDLEDGVDYEVGYPIIAGQTNNVDGLDIVKRATTSTKTTSTQKPSSIKTTVKTIVKTTSTAKASPIATKPATTSSKKVSSTVKTSSTVKSLSAAPAKASTYQQRVLVSHNIHRANHSASNLV
jgi:hypothetical protein